MFLLLLLLLFFPRPVLADNEFNLNQTVEYQIQTNGTASVNEDDTLSNNFSQIYAKQYQINIGLTGLTNLKVNDDFGNALDSATTASNSTNILLKFNQPGIGKDQKTHFTVNYQIPAFAKKKGKTWEISLPTINRQSGQNTNLILDVPTTFGELSSSSVNATTAHDLGDTRQYQFQNPSPTDKILLVFGDSQLFDFKFDYYLQNDSSNAVNTDIALPPDTDSQIVHYAAINPTPISVNQDNDGNWLATYQLPAKSSLTVNATGQAKIIPSRHFITTINSTDYLTEAKYWPVNSNSVQSVSANLTSPKSIYDFVVNYLQYDYDRLTAAGRMGADTAIAQPQNSLCTEFADLFVTLSRHRQIPAREIEGFAYSTDSKVKPTNPNSDILHAWAQYYDSSSQTWNSVDPTWEKTTNGIDYFHDLDLNHFTFVIHGLKSDYPSPPGSYKNNHQVKTVSVDFATNEAKTTYLAPTFKISQNQLVVTNPNLSSLNQIKVSLNGSKWNETIMSLPPLGQVTTDFPYSLTAPKFQINYESRELAAGFSYTTNPARPILTIIALASAIFLLSLIGIILVSTNRKNEKNS